MKSSRDPSAKAENSSPFARSFMRRSAWLLCLTMTVSSLTGIATVSLFAFVFQVVAGRYLAGVAWPATFVLLGVFLISSRTISVLAMERLSRTAIAEIRLQLAKEILSTPLDHLEKVSETRLLTGLTKEVMAVSMEIPTLVNLCTSIAMVIALMLYIAWLTPIGALLIAIAVFVGAPLHWLFLRRLIALSYNSGRAWDRLYRNLDGLVSGLKQLKLNSGRKDAFIRIDLVQRQAEFLRAKSQVVLAGTMASNCAQVIFLAVLGCSLFALTADRQGQEYIGAEFLFALIYLMGPLERVLGSFAALGEVKAAYRRLRELGLSLSAVEKDDRGTINEMPPIEWNRLSLRRVSYAYPGESGFAFGPVDLTLSRGEIVFVTGGNGSGKSTFAKLVAGLYVPACGEIILGHTSIDETCRQMYREHFAAVLDDVYLFERLWFKGTCDVMEGEKHLNQWGLTKLVEIRDNCFTNTTALSRGQKKRLALVAAVMEDKTIYIFDEWAADQDAVSRRYFYKTFLPELRRMQKLVIVLTHDEGYDDIADRILRFHEGKLISPVVEVV
ncbi:cyclic peptide export ABC transporter [Bradyrhizobium roseum]|uniref:cyclic peptide export ABC transporter n=1 Tax=Bradyrhizobium roseum TaxID=3056648 RepID=UPI002631EBE4|nr:cyclic peptide export ABC transporter [Bradyrhizobium roseus]WKA26397.1 cyclic peptide export ABC transporter [Bradyrhizobium roseus]